jgi:MFS family permease
MFGNYYLYDSIAPAADLLIDQLGYSQLNIGQLQSVYSAAAILFLIFGGVFIDRFGTKITILVFGIVCGIAGIVTAASDELAVMLTGRFILGLGAEPLIVAVTTALAKWFKGKELGFAMGINLTISRLASIFADRSTAFESIYNNWQTPLYFAALIGLLCVICGVVYYFMEKYAENKFDLGEAGEIDKLNIRELFSFNRSFWIVVLLCVTFYSAVFPFRSFAIIFFMDAHNATKEFAGMLNSILPTTALIATPLFGLFVDRFGKRASMMFLGAAMILPVYLMMAYSDISLYVPTIMLGIAFSLIPAIMWPSVAYIVKEKRLGTGYALMTLIQQVGVLVFNYMIGWANNYTGASEQTPQGYNLGMWIFSILGILAFVFAFMLWKREKGPYSHGLEKPAIH